MDRDDIERWGRAAHHCALYSSPADLFEIERSFRQSAAASGATVVDYVPAPIELQRSGTFDREVIGSIASEIESAVTREAARTGGIWWTGDLSLLCGLHLPPEALVDLDATISSLLVALDVKALCRYDRRLLDEPTESSLGMLHEHVTTAGPPPELRLRWRSWWELVVCGQVDGGAVPLLDQVLGGCQAERLTIDLGGVEFLDAAGASALCQTAFAGRQVELTRVRWPVARVLGLADLDLVPGVVIEQGDPR